MCKLLTLLALTPETIAHIGWCCSFLVMGVLFMKNTLMDILWDTNDLNSLRVKTLNCVFMNLSERLLLSLYLKCL